MTSRASRSAAAGSRGGPPLRVGIEQRIDLARESELIAEHPRIQRTHAREVGEQPAGGDLAGRLLVFGDRERDTGGDPCRGRALGGGLALGEQSPPVGDSRAGPEEGQPLVCELTRQADRGWGERREEDRDGPFGRGAQPKRPDVVAIVRQASALEQRPDSDERGAHASRPVAAR